MKNLRWGIVGCGDVCEVKSGPALQKARGSELVAVCRRQADKAEDFAKRHGVPRWSGNVLEIINDPEVDIVYVATPPGSHLEIAKQVAAAGKPCYVEKPMARTFAECDAMNRAFAEAGQKLFVAYYRRRLPRFVAIKEWLDEGKLGQITSVDLMYTSNQMRELEPGELPWRFDPVVSGGGLFIDLGSHALDALDMLLGPVTEVTGRADRVAADSGVEDRVVAQFMHESGVAGTALWDFASGGAPADYIMIRGSKGSVRCSVFTHTDVELNIDGQETTHSFPDPPHVHQPLVQTVVDDLAGTGQCPSTGDSAARTSAVMDTLTQGFYGDRTDGFWDRRESWGQQQT